MEQNKIRTYLLYALGEILLVVIGILIALQVNNWNEERKLKNQVETYLFKLLEEAEYNVAALGSVYDAGQSGLESSTQAAEMLSRKEMPDGSDSVFTRGIASLGFYSSLKPYRSVYDEANNAGIIQHIESNEVRISINRFITQTETYSESLDFFRRTFNNPMDFADNDYKKVYDANSRLKTRDEFNFENLANNETFVAIVNRGLRNLIVFRGGRRALVLTAESMCDTLAEELNTTCSPDYVREDRREE